MIFADVIFAARGVRPVSPGFVHTTRWIVVPLDQYRARESHPPPIDSLAKARFGERLSAFADPKAHSTSSWAEPPG